MRKAILNLLLIVIFFTFEFVIFNLIGRIFVPNLLLLLVVFATLAFGIRHGLACGIVAGFLKDCFSSQAFGLNLFTFIVCAFSTVILRKKFYRAGSKSSRLLLVFLVLCIELIMRMMVHLMFGPVSLSEVFSSIFIPEVIMTLLIAPYVFEHLKRCVLKLSVL